MLELTHYIQTSNIYGVKLNGLLQRFGQLDDQISSWYNNAVHGFTIYLNANGWCSIGYWHRNSLSSLEMEYVLGEPYRAIYWYKNQTAIIEFDRQRAIRRINFVERIHRVNRYLDQN